ncbi:MAG: hypothetical protein ACO1N9_07635 [Flavobacterium sp.]
MKRKFAIFNLALMVLVLFATAYQSFHAFSHTHNHSHHEKKAKHFSGADQSHDDEDCSVCDFHFDFFTAPPQFCLRLYFPFKEIPYTFNSVEGSANFCGSLFDLRGPPQFV